MFKIMFIVQESYSNWWTSESDRSFLLEIHNVFGFVLFFHDRKYFPGIHATSLTIKRKTSETTAKSKKLPAWWWENASVTLHQAFITLCTSFSLLFSVGKMHKTRFLFYQKTRILWIMANQAFDFFYCTKKEIRLCNLIPIADQYMLALAWKSNILCAYLDVIQW